jgi:hypothetical protein
MLNVESLDCEKPSAISKGPRAIYSLRGKSVIMEMMDALNRLGL